MSKIKSATGIVRRIDNLGRVVIPKEIRTSLGVKEGDPVEISLEKNFICVKKPTFGCKLCNKTLNEVELENKFNICKSCETEIKSL